jgi:hypothetical protein
LIATGVFKVSPVGGDLEGAGAVSLRNSIKHLSRLFAANPRHKSLSQNLQLWVFRFHPAAIYHFLNISKMIKWLLTFNKILYEYLRSA